MKIAKSFSSILFVFLFVSALSSTSFAKASPDWQYVCESNMKDASIYVYASSVMRREINGYVYAFTIVDWRFKNPRNGVCGELGTWYFCFDRVRGTLGICQTTSTYYDKEGKIIRKEGVDDTPATKLDYMIVPEDDGVAWPIYRKIESLPNTSGR